VISDNKLLIKKIKDTLYNRDGNLNSAILRRSNFLNSPLYKEILENTNFLASNSTLAERIYCVCNGINEVVKCNCNKPLQWRGFKNKPYSQSCNSNICKRKNKKWKSSSETKIIKNKEIKNSFLSFIENNDYKDAKATKEFCESRLKHKTPFNLGLFETHKQILAFLFKNHYTQPNNLNIKWSRFFYDFYNEITSQPICEICKKELTFRNSVFGYSGCNNTECLQTKIQNIKNNFKCNEVNDYLQKRKLKLLTSHLLNETSHTLKCEVCDLVFDSFINNGRWKNVFCKNCNPNKSKPELEMVEFIKELNCEFICNDRHTIAPKELDIFLPQYSLAIECNGIYWHSECQGKNKKYHLEKTNLAKEKNIQILQFWDTEWNNKKEIIKSIISYKLGKSKNKIGARKCELKQIKDKKVKSKFLNENHIQGNDNSQLSYGLFIHGELISLMTFGYRKITKEQQMNWELIRFCNKMNYSVPGAASKLLNHFIETHHPNKIITYADRRYSNGIFYEKLGFTLKRISSPGYWYNINGNLKHRSGFMKHRLNKIFKNFDNNLSEYQNMIKNGYDRVWDCGQYVFELQKS